MAALACFILLIATPAAAGEGCVTSSQANKRLVLDFYKLALIDQKPRLAFERFVAPDFVEHKPDVPGGTRESASLFLEQLIAQLPKPRWEILRTIAEGDLVFLHAKFRPADGAGEYAIVDIFRVSDCRIVEHWDVVAGPPDSPRNPNARF